MASQSKIPVPGLLQQADEIFRETAGEVSLLDTTGEEWPVLYKLTDLIHRYSARIGYPELIVNPSDASDKEHVLKKFSAITVGRDKVFPDAYLWQISLRENQQRALLHGRSTRTGENWQHISFDAQHTKSSEFIRGHGELITEFVVQTLIEGDVIGRIQENFDCGRHLSYTGLHEVHSAKKRKLDNGRSGEYVQIDQSDLPAWILQFLLGPVDTVDIPGCTAATASEDAA